MRIYVVELGADYDGRWTIAATPDMAEAFRLADEPHAASEVIITVMAPISTGEMWIKRLHHSPNKNAERYPKGWRVGDYRTNIPDPDRPTMFKQIDCPLFDPKTIPETCYASIPKQG